MSMFHYYDLGYSEAFIFDEFLVNQIREGITITPKHNEKLKETIDKHFKDRPVVYISNRIHSYSVDPLTYIETSKIHNLLAIAVVSDNINYRESAAYESKFYEKPFAIFETLSEAIEWVHKTIQEQMD
ncbi:MAG: hypothetical protein KTR22_14445 [Flavobacteriaceae bacterium]|nr:hypothetical protein [Flavobacteriaceae bacterium]